MHRQVDVVQEKLHEMRREGIWPNGERYLWTDAFGVVLLVSLYNELGEEAYLDEAEHVVSEVGRVLGRSRGLRIGEAADRDGQYFHYLAMWIYALTQLGHYRPAHRDGAIALVREIHPRFVQPDVGVLWKMDDDLEAAYPGYGLGALDAFHGYVVYRLLDEEELSGEIAQMEALVLRSYRDLHVTQDLGVGMMLWMSHFFPAEGWAAYQRARCMETLAEMWIDPPGYFCRYPYMDEVRFAFTNYGISLGLQAVGSWDGRVDRLNDYFESYRSGDAYDRAAITHVMACTSHFPGAFVTRYDLAAPSADR